MKSSLRSDARQWTSALSAHYRVCLRTIEQRIYFCIVPGQKKAGKLEFNEAEGYRRLLAQKRKTKNYEKTNGTTKINTHQTTQPAAMIYDLDIEVCCCQHKKLEQRLMSGTLEQAVYFFNQFAQYVRLGVTTTKFRDENVSHLKRRGVSMSYLHRCSQQIGRFVKSEPGEIGEIQPSQIDNYLQALAYTPRGKHDCRAVLVAFFDFARDVGRLAENPPKSCNVMPDEMTSPTASGT